MIPRPRARRCPDFSLATINIVFLLLLFFLIAGSVVQKAETTVDIPLATKLPVENLPRPLLVVSYDALFLDGRPITQETLATQATESLKVRGGFINILAERDQPATRLLDVLDILSGAGLPARIVTVKDDADTGAAP